MTSSFLLAAHQLAVAAGSAQRTCAMAASAPTPSPLGADSSQACCTSENSAAASDRRLRGESAAPASAACCRSFFLLHGAQAAAVVCTSQRATCTAMQASHSSNTPGLNAQVVGRALLGSRGPPPAAAAASIAAAAAGGGTSHAHHDISFDDVRKQWSAAGREQRPQSARKHSEQSAAQEAMLLL